MSSGRRVRAPWRLAGLAGGGLAAATGAAVGAWALFVRHQGDSEMAYATEELSGVTWEDGVLRGTIRLENRGRQTAVVRRIEGQVVSGGTGEVAVTRQGSRPHVRGWWSSNLVEPGESCVAEVDITLDPTAGEPSRPRPVVIELDLQEIGRTPAVQRRALIKVPTPVPVLGRPF
ncbi:MAG TPA: hypothetical protein VE152_04065 [Acidimicrobiales bacterium]|jgi:hypothetical protein|nr:hypothetical protein [Acidimicrobiales bacterium]